MRLDRRDVKILAALQRDGRITNRALAELVHLSPSACLERLHRLEAEGLIRGYAAEVAVERVVRCVGIFVEVTLTRHESGDFGRFEKAVQDVPEIVECDALGGGIDYLLKIVALDLDHYQALIDRLLDAQIGIGRYFTYVVTKSVKKAPAPLEKLLKQRETARSGPGAE